MVSAIILALLTFSSFVGFIALATVGLLPRKLLSLFALIQHFQWKKGKFRPKKKRVFNFHEIIPGLFVGTQPRNGEDIKNLRDNFGVTAIICLNEEWELYVPSSGSYISKSKLLRLHVPVPDYQGPNIEELKKCVTFIHEVLNGGGKVFVHCNGGKGRSAAVAVAYILATDANMKNYKDAVKFVKSRRSVTSKSLTRYPLTTQSRNLLEFQQVVALKPIFEGINSNEIQLRGKDLVLNKRGAEDEDVFTKMGVVENLNSLLNHTEFPRETSEEFSLPAPMGEPLGLRNRGVIKVEV